MVYGYCRISTSKQNIDRQVRNILAEYNDAKIIKETYSGTKFQERKEFDKLLRLVKAGDTIVFDSVSRMARNAADGVELYFSLLEKGINLVFLKEHYIDTSVYMANTGDKIELMGTDEDEIIKGINNYFRRLAKKQIEIAFKQAQKEVDDLHQRTKEGIETARLNGKRIGRQKGATVTTKKSIEAKEKIRKYNRSFDGTLTNEETWKLIGISKMTFYKYKKEMDSSKKE